MDKLEKVKKGLDCCLHITRDCPQDCPYERMSFCRDWLIHDVKELLKEQQAEIDRLKAEQERSKHGHWIVLTDCSNGGVYCSECNNKMFDRYPMKKKFSQYCAHCGAHNDLNVEMR